MHTLLNLCSQRALSQHESMLLTLALTLVVAAKAELGLAVSVGVACNKLLAKLGSVSAKPDGLAAVEGTEAVQQLLAATPARRLPSCGGKVIEALEQAGIRTVTDLQVPSSPRHALNTPVITTLDVGICN